MPKFVVRIEELFTREVCVEADDEDTARYEAQYTDTTAEFETYINKSDWQVTPLSDLDDDEQEHWNSEGGQ